MSAQRLFHAALDTGSADANTRNAKRWIVAHREALDRTDVADDMTHNLRVMIDAAAEGFGLDARQLGRHQVDGGNLVPGEIARNQDRKIGRLALCTRDNTRAFVGRNGHDLRKPFEREIHVSRECRYDRYAERLIVGRQRDAEAIENPPPCRGQRNDVQAVVVGKERIAAGIQHLDLVEPRAQYAEAERLSQPQQHGAPRKGPALVTCKDRCGLALVAHHSPRSRRLLTRTGSADSPGTSSSITK